MKPTISTSFCCLLLLAGCADYGERTALVSGRPVYIASSRRVLVQAPGRVVYQREPTEITRTEEALAQRRVAIRRQEAIGEREREIYTSTDPKPSGRVSTSLPSAPPPSQPPPLQPDLAPPRPGGPPAVAEQTDVPTAAPVKGKPGYVTSPFAPASGFVDVNGLPSGSEARDPYTGKIFKVP